MYIKWITALLILSLMAGCSATPPEKPMAEWDTDQLCITTIVDAPRKAAAEAELGKRQATCDWAKVQIMIDQYNADRQAQQARAAAAMGMWMQMQQNNQMLYQQQQQMYAPRSPVNCTTTYVGNQAHSTCR